MYTLSHIKFLDFAAANKSHLLMQIAHRLRNDIDNTPPYEWSVCTNSLALQFVKSNYKSFLERQIREEHPDIPSQIRAYAVLLDQQVPFKDSCEFLRTTRHRLDNVLSKFVYQSFAQRLRRATPNFNWNLVVPYAKQEIARLGYAAEAVQKRLSLDAPVDDLIRWTPTFIEKCAIFLQECDTNADVLQLGLDAIKGAYFNSVSDGTRLLNVDFFRRATDAQMERYDNAFAAAEENKDIIQQARIQCVSYSVHRERFQTDEEMTEWLTRELGEQPDCFNAIDSDCLHLIVTMLPAADAVRLSSTCRTMRKRIVTCCRAQIEWLNRCEEQYPRWIPYCPRNRVPSHWVKEAENVPPMLTSCDLYGLAEKMAKLAEKAAKLAEKTGKLAEKTIPPPKALTNRFRTAVRVRGRLQSLPNEFKVSLLDGRNMPPEDSKRQWDQFTNMFKAALE